MDYPVNFWKDRYGIANDGFAACKSEAMDRAARVFGKEWVVTGAELEEIEVSTCLRQDAESAWAEEVKAGWAEVRQGNGPLCVVIVKTWVTTQHEEVPEDEE